MVVESTSKGMVLNEFVINCIISLQGYHLMYACSPQCYILLIHSENN
jgi:hypothetical protein